MGNANSQDGLMECCASRTRDNHGGSSREKERIQKMQQPEWGCCDVNDTEFDAEDSERSWKNARREGSQQPGVEMWTTHSAGNKESLDFGCGFDLSKRLVRRS
jgi:hypothetical protein